MDKIKGQASKVSGLLFDRETGATYKKTVTLTWNILRETGVLLWLIICLVFVGAEWFWHKSIALGKSTRNWYEDLQAPSAEEPKSASEIGESALTALGTGAETLLYQAKKQLGIDAEPPAPRPRKPKAEVAPEPTAVSTPEPATPASTAPAPVKPTTTAIASAAAQGQLESASASSFASKADEPAAIADADDDASTETAADS